MRRARWIALGGALCILFTAQTQGRGEEAKASSGLHEPRPPAATLAVSSNAYSELINRHARASGIPAELVAAVIHIESGYNPSVVGTVGEIGLMQVRPETAAMLGFKGDLAVLSEPEINIRLGARYLAKAWRLAGGDLCRTLIKYRAGHGEERETPRSTHYCKRAQEYLAGRGSTLAMNSAVIPAPSSLAKSSSVPMAPRGTPQASRQFWAAHEARILKLRMAVRAKWSKVAQLSPRR